MENFIMENFNEIVVTLLFILSLISIVTPIMVFLLLCQIERNVETFFAEFRKNANAQSKALDRDFAEIGGELKKISYRLDAIVEQLYRIQDSYTANDVPKTQGYRKEREEK